MVEEPHSCKRHRHPVGIGGLDHVIVSDAAARLRDVLNAGLRGALDIVAEGEEGVRAEGYAGDGIEIGSLLCVGIWLRPLGEEGRA